MRPLTFLLALLCAVAAQATAQAQSRWVKHYHERVQKFRVENGQLDPKVANVVLVGDSLTEGWKYRHRVRKYLPKSKDRVLNRGIVSDGVGLNRRGVLNRLDESVFDTHPSHVFLLIGVNDLDPRGRRIDAIAKAYRKVVTRIRKRLPKVPMVLITCTPVGGKYSGRNPAIVRLNTRIKAIAKDLGCKLIDLHPLIADARGAMPARLSRDGLHFNDQGYAILGREIEKAVAATERRSPSLPSDDAAGLIDRLPTK